MSTKWYWCLSHDRVESDDERDDPDNALGPYESPEAARNWRERVEERAEDWKAQDESWNSPDLDDDRPS